MKVLWNLPKLKYRFDKERYTKKINGIQEWQKITTELCSSAKKRSCLNLGIINDLMQTRQEVAYNRILCILRHKILVRILEWGDSYRKPCWPVLENCIPKKISLLWKRVDLCYENRVWSKKNREWSEEN